METRILVRPMDSARRPRPFDHRESLPQYFYPFLSPISDAADEIRVHRFVERLNGATRVGELASVYIHIPFCRNFCIFCPIYKTRLPDEAGLAAYVDQLIREMDVYEGLPHVRGLNFGAVYIGGGSPTCLPPRLLQRLLIAVRDHFALTDDCEITVEGEVRTLNDPRRLEALRAGGCTRISFGVQSLDPFVRRKANLRPRLTDIRTCVENLRNFGYTVNMDMMFGLAGQTLAVWRDDLAQAVDLGADQIDCYDTVAYPNTKLFRLRRKYREIMADESLKIAMFEHALDFLPQQGLFQRTNAIFSRQSNIFTLPSLLNSEGTYEMVALGDSSIGYLNGSAYRNASPIDAYMAWAGNPLLPVRLIHTLTLEERFTKRMLSFCRLLKVEKKQLDEGLLTFMRPVIDDLTARGVLAENSRSLWITRLGRIWYDNVFLSFLPAAQRLKMWKIMY